MFENKVENKVLLKKAFNRVIYPTVYARKERKKRIKAYV